MKKSTAAILKIFLGIQGSFVLLTLNWILWGLFTPGDFFGNGSPLIYASAAAAGVVGFSIGFRAKQRTVIIAVIIFVILCLIFWLFVRDGWWAAPPPMPIH